MRKQEVIILLAVAALLAAAAYLLMPSGSSTDNSKQSDTTSPSPLQQTVSQTRTATRPENTRRAVSPSAGPKPSPTMPSSAARVSPRPASPLASRPAPASRAASANSSSQESTLTSVDKSSGALFTIPKGSNQVEVRIPRKIKIKPESKLYISCTGHTQLRTISNARWNPQSRLASQRLQARVLPKRLKVGQVVKSCQLFNGRRTPPLATAGFSAIPAPSDVYQRMMRTQVSMLKALRSGKSWKKYCSYWVSEHQKKCRRHFARVKAKIGGGRLDVAIQPMGTYRQGVGTIQVRDSSGAFDQIMFLRQSNGRMKAFHSGVTA